MGKGSERRKRQRAHKVYEFQIEPALDSAQRRMHSQFVIDPRRAAENEKIFQAGKEKVLRLQGRLLDPKVKKEANKIVGKIKTDTMAQRPPHGYYVIVGRGAAAVVNHTTLRQSTEGKVRLGDLPVMHVGFPDPWLTYHAHGMGQPPYLLRMPGYHNPVAATAATIRSGLNSQVFAASTKAELDMLQSKFEVYVVTAWVAAILKKGDDTVDLGKALVELGQQKSKVDEILALEHKATYPAYRLLVVTPDAGLHFIYAHNIDICSGAGQPNIVPRTGPQAAFKEAEPAPWIPASKRDKTRKVVHGMDGLTETLPWNSKLRYCVCGAGGIGLNQVERAHDVGNYLDWYATGTMHATTFGLRRNDTVLKSKVGNTFMNAGDADEIRIDGVNFKTDFPLIPGSPKWRFGQDCPTPTVTVKDGRLKMVFDAPKGYLYDHYSDYNTPKVVQKLVGDHFPLSTDCKVAGGAAATSWYNDGRTESEYDRLILCMGQAPNSISDAKSLFGATPPQFIVYDGRMIGLKDASDKIRILGAAAAAFPGMMAKAPEGTAMETFRASLPVSAVPPGFILSGVNIATANGFFAEKPNTNVNTMSGTELKTLLVDKLKLGGPDADRVRDKLLNARRFPNNGIADKVALALVLDGEVKKVEILDALDTDYRAAEPFA